MSGATTLSRDLALKIGLAARALPDIDAKHLVAVLGEKLGLPLNAVSLAHLDLASFKSYFPGLADPTLSIAIQILQQPLEISLDSQAEPAADLPNSVRIACASTDGKMIDGHFGSCAHFLIYQVSANAVRLAETRSAELPSGLEVPDKNTYRAELIEDCRVLYVAAVGGPAAAKIVRLGIHPMKLPEVRSIDDVINELQTVMAGSPPPWLAKAMGLDQDKQLRFAEEAGA